MNAVLTLAVIALLAAPQAPPKPGPEHKLLTADAGTWDAVVEMHAEPGKPPMKSKGVEVNTIGCSGRCLITNFKGDMGGAPFEGAGVTTYDPKKKKYISSWTDSMSAGLSLGESTYDASTKKWSGFMEGPDMSGNIMKARSVVEVTAAGTRVFTLYGPGPDGKEGEMMKITYTRRK
jgi:Protein of unknown function (DUF1579)